MHFRFHNAFPSSNLYTIYKNYLLEGNSQSKIYNEKSLKKEKLWMSNVCFGVVNTNKWLARSVNVFFKKNEQQKLSLRFKLKTSQITENFIIRW